MHAHLAAAWALAAFVALVSASVLAAKDDDQASLLERPLKVRPSPADVPEAEF